MMPGEKLGPGVPAELKYVDLRLPGTFRELVANNNFTNDEIGRIVRCIALDTEFYLTPRIEPEVYYYHQHQKMKADIKKRVRKCREKRRAMQAAGLVEHGNDVTVTKGSVTVTHDSDSAEADTSSLRKTPPITEEKTPPIVPLEKNPSAPLESGNRRKRRIKNGRRLAAGIQRDLFSMEPLEPPGSQESKQGASLERSDAPGGMVVPQVIESDSRPVLKGMDTRVDAAWIPERFAAFWAQYPKKVAKGDALKAFTRLIKSQSDVEKFMKTLLASLEWWKGQGQWTKDGGKFVPNPATWLNRGNWEDIKDNQGLVSGKAEFLQGDSESDDDLIRRMQGG